MALMKITPMWKTVQRNKKVYLKSRNMGKESDKKVYLQLRENDFKGQGNSSALFGNEPDAHLLVDDAQLSDLISCLQAMLDENVQDVVEEQIETIEETKPKRGRPKKKVEVG